MHDIKNWTGPISEAAIFDLSPGTWTRQIALENGEDGQNAILTVLRTNVEGPYLIVAGDTACRIALEPLKRISGDLKSGTLILIEYSGSTAPALESPLLWPLLDAVDEVIIVTKLNGLLWDKLANPRFRTSTKETVLRDAMRSMQELGLIGSTAAQNILAKTLDGHSQTVI